MKCHLLFYCIDLKLAYFRLIFPKPGFPFSNSLTCGQNEALWTSFLFCSIVRKFSCIPSLFFLCLCLYFIKLSTPAEGNLWFSPQEGAGQPVEEEFSLKWHACSLELVRKFKKICRISSRILKCQHFQGIHIQGYCKQILKEDGLHGDGK